MTRASTATSPRRKIATRRAKPTAANVSGTPLTIVMAAREVLAKEGNAQLTLRRVAEVAGITVGNLTYHFPNKRELLRALIASFIADYNAASDAFFSDLSMSPAEEFRALIEWVINDSANREVSRVYRELWAMALHDPYIAREIDNLYDQATARCARLLRRSHPHLTQESADTIAHLMAMVAEGGSVIYGTRPARAADLKDVIALAGELLGAAAQKKTKR